MGATQSLLWQLTPPPGEPVSYVFGTMHARDQRAFSGLEKVYASLDRSDLVALEIDMDPSQMVDLPGSFMLPEND